MFKIESGLCGRQVDSQQAKRPATSMVPCANDIPDENQTELQGKKRASGHCVKEELL